MSDKPRGFRSASIVVFWIALLVVVIGCAAIGIYQLTVAEKRNRQSQNFDPLYRVAQQEVADYMKSLEKPADTVFVDKNPIIAGNTYHPAEIHDTLFSFEIVYDSLKNGDDEWRDFIKSVHIIRLSDHSKIQTVFLPESYPFESYSIPVVVEDMNFDGYNDFRVVDFVMMYGQSSYHFWLYNPKTKLFEPDTALAKTYSARFDPVTKMVYSSCRLSGPFDIVNQAYSWENKTLVLQEEEQLFTHPGHVLLYEITMTKRINGKLVTRSKDFTEPPLTNTGEVIFDWQMLK